MDVVVVRTNLAGEEEGSSLFIGCAKGVRRSLQAHVTQEWTRCITQIC